MTEKICTEKLLKMTSRATSPFHTVLAVKTQLEEENFTQLDLDEEWQLERGGKYFYEHNGSALFAFRIGIKESGREYFRIGAAHTDFPGLRLKVRPEIKSEGYAQLNVEVYGGAILNTWLDRPLSVSGRVALKSGAIFRPRMELVDFKVPILTIPNLAIHLNKSVNKGVELNRQKDMLPVLGMAEDILNEDGYFMKLLAKELDVDPEDILDYELNIYNTDEGGLVGIRQDLISSPRLDDLSAVQAVTTGLIEGSAPEGIHLAAFFDHEEVGSTSKQGAASSLLAVIAQKILAGIGKPEGYAQSLKDSLMLSMDVAHAVHPNKAEKSDLINKGKLNKGFCIKEACSQSYATDSEAIAIVQQICEAENIPYQKIHNRSDAVGGSTLGSIASAMMPVKTVDLGIPLLAMHSSRELGGAKDQVSAVNLMRAFYSLKN